MDFKPLHTVQDIDFGRIPDNPAILGGHKIPKSNYVQKPFRFGGDNWRFYNPSSIALQGKKQSK
ncbi:MAG: hypothetical protein ACPHF2_03205 [Crocinitomicaceae bacterium]